MKKEKIKPPINKKKRLLAKLRSFTRKEKVNFILLLLNPILIFFSSEFLNESYIFLEFPRMLLNFIFIYALLGISYALIGSSKKSYIFTDVCIFLIGVISYLVNNTRGTPLVPWDIFSVGTALTVAKTYSLHIDIDLAIGILLFLINLIIIIKYIDIPDAKTNFKNIVKRFSILFTALTFIICFFHTNLISIFNLNENWDPKEEYRNNGLVASLFKQSKNLIIDEPENYSKNYINDLASTILVNDSTIEIDYDSLPNIIAIMNESFADLRVINDFPTNEEYLPFIKNLSGNTMKGNVHVSIFGAQTPNSEWEFLTNNSMAFVPYRTIPYQQYVTKETYSLASILKELGYSTSAFHCYYSQGYNRNIVYPLMGFDRFYSMNELENLNIMREYPDDISTYENIIQLFKNKEKDEKIFNFTLTMQNHSSYDFPNFENTIYYTGEGNFPKLNQWLTCIKKSDEAFEHLINYFSTYDEPTIIVMFGDHQPYVEDEFYNLLFSNYENPSDISVQDKKYITPYILWANYDIDTKEIPDISTNYLSSLVLDVAEIPKTPYIKYLDKLREEIPVITGNGYMDKTGTYHNFSDETEYSKLVEEYHFLQYHNMFDSDKITSLFTIPIVESSIIEDIIEGDIETKINN